jgi:hypothetical protein
MSQNNLKRSKLAFHLNSSIWELPENEAILCPFNAALPDERSAYFNHPWLSDSFWHECGYVGISEH